MTAFIRLTSFQGTLVLQIPLYAHDRWTAESKQVRPHIWTDHHLDGPKV